jgi:hypothetical protein
MAAQIIERHWERKFNYISRDYVLHTDASSLPDGAPFHPAFNDYQCNQNLIIILAWSNNH